MEQGGVEWNRGLGQGEARSMGTALIVEDHPDQAMMVAALLRYQNYEPIVAGTGEMGLRLARDHSPDVVLLDLMSPDISGFDVCRRLRSDRASSRPVAPSGATCGS